MLVLHYTGMESCSQALDQLCDPASKVSAHVLIDEDGTFHRLIGDEYRAWHAGTAYWRGISDVNSASIGIELANPGHEYGYRPFPEAQIKVLIDVCRQMINEYGIPGWGVVGHSDIAPSLKTDPGELFPWQRLAKAGLGLWPDTTDFDKSNDPWTDLAKIGYAVPGDINRGSTILAPETAQTDIVSSFQRRFRPAHISGALDSETLRLITAIAEISS